MNILRRAVISAALIAPTLLHAQTSQYYEQTYMRASHNWAFRSNYPNADRLFNAFDYGHAILYETLWRQPTASPAALDVDQFGFITTKLLVHPPRVMLDESAIGPEWSKLAPEALMMFEWAHMLHRQVYDVWADDRISVNQKDKRVAQLVSYYKSRPSLAFSSKPKDMELMEGQSYSLAFRKKYPKFNGLIWSYHWLQMTLYDGLIAGQTPQERHANVDQVVAAFRSMTLNPSSFPEVMPMSPAIAPAFSARYPEAAAIFDNLHSLHDVVSDILANPVIPRDQKRAAILRAAATYRDDHTSVTSIADWQTMSNEMGAQKMGGRPSFKR